MAAYVLCEATVFCKSRDRLYLRRALIQQAFEEALVFFTSETGSKSTLMCPTQTRGRAAVSLYLHEPGQNSKHRKQDMKPV